MGLVNWLRNKKRIREQRLQALATALEVERKRDRVVDSHMNQGDFHSGPEGYSPNTAYPETQYGSWWDEDADWNEEQ